MGIVGRFNFLVDEGEMHSVPFGRACKLADGGAVETSPGEALGMLMHAVDLPRKIQCLAHAAALLEQIEPDCTFSEQEEAFLISARNVVRYWEEKDFANGIETSFNGDDLTINGTTT